jgi:Holliday junction resolvase RusA-like endonuclease
MTTSHGCRPPFLDCFVCGDPKTKGSTRSFLKSGRIVTTNMCKTAKQWQRVVHQVVHFNLPATHIPVDRPVAVHLNFALSRPRNHFLVDGIRKDAPVYHESRGDLDKLVRCVLDGLTGLVYSDDSKASFVLAEKRYVDCRYHAEQDRLVGVRIQAWKL